MLRAEELVASLPPNQSQGLPWPGPSYPKVIIQTFRGGVGWSVDLVCMPTLSRIKARLGKAIEDYRCWDAQELLAREGDPVLEDSLLKPQARHKAS